MKLKNVNGHLSELPHNHRSAIAGLIDLAVEEKMDRVLAKLDNMQVQIDAKFDAMESKFDYRLEATDAKLESMQRSTDAKLESMQLSNEVLFKAYVTQVRSIKWTIIASFTVIGLAIKFFPSGFIN